MRGATDPAVVQAARQADAAWAALNDSHVIVYLTGAGLLVNFLLALVAIAIPAWQRAMTKRDQSESLSRARHHFIDAFKALSRAQTDIVDVTKLQNPEAVERFRKLERSLRGASLALTQSSAAAIPVSAIMSAAVVQHNAAKTLAHYPDLVNYGSNLLFYNGLGAEFESYADEARSLLATIEGSEDWSTI